MLWIGDNNVFLCHVVDWFLATQGLMCVGLAVTFLALLIATIALCCECRRCNSNHVVAGFLLMGCECPKCGISVNFTT